MKTWTSPYTVAVENPICRILVFRDNVPNLHTTIMGPPIAGNPSWLPNLIEDQNLVSCALEHTKGGVIVIDWKPATQTTTNTSIRDLERMYLLAVAYAKGSKTHVVGLCQSGYVAALTESHYKNKIDLLTLAGTPIDTSTPSQISPAQKFPLWVYKMTCKLHGDIMPGKVLLDSWRKANKDVHDKKEKLPENKRFYEWFNTPVDIAGGKKSWYLWAMEHVFLNQNLLGMLAVSCPINLAYGTRDKITPKEQLLAIIPNCHNSVNVYAVEGGHIGVFIGKHAIEVVFPKIFREASALLDT